MSKNISIIIHAGAGDITLEKFQDRYGENAEAEIKNHHEILHKIVNDSYDILNKGESALETVTKAIVALENCPYFNSGKGSAISANGLVEMDASIMDGNTGNNGGVSTVTIVKNPILAARSVMEHSIHSLLCAEGANHFAKAQGLEIVENNYFRTAHIEKAWKEAQSKNELDPHKALGTVGAAAIDQNGHTAAGTSTGGLINKAQGRVSDSAIVGAGTWAADNICAISCTGTGDTFIRNATAKDVAAMVEYKGMSLETAFQIVLHKIEEAGGIGGLIGIDKNGQPVMDFNASGMFRGFRGTKDAKTFTGIF